MSYGPIQPVAAFEPCPDRLAILTLPARWSVWRPSGESRLIHDRIHPMVRCRAAAADFRSDDRVTIGWPRPTGTAPGTTMSTKTTRRSWMRLRAIPHIPFLIWVVDP